MSFKATIFINNVQLAKVEYADFIEMRTEIQNFANKSNCIVNDYMTSTLVKDADGNVVAEWRHEKNR